MRPILTTLLFSLLPLTTPSPLPNPPTQWHTLPSIPLAARQEHSTFFLPPSTIGILGGVVPNGTTSVSTTPLMQFYSLTHNTWSTMPPMPKPLNHVNVAVAHGKIYVLGGLADAPAGVSWNATAESWIYDPSTQAWEAIAPLPEGEVRGSAAMGVWGDKIILAGGMRALVLSGPGAGLQDTVDVVSMFDTGTGEYVAVPEAAKRMPGGRDHAGAAVVGGKMYVLGGREGGQLNVKDTVFVLDLGSMEEGWRVSGARMPTARGGVAAGVIGKRVFTFGGEGNQELESRVFNQTEVYDTVGDNWEELEQMAVPRHGTYAVGVGDRVYVPGGGVQFGGEAPVATFDAFSPFHY
ncbi:galactose oxidase [Polyplosphaeria fusca]|uniref:Galactose oxidase n=1 Tax=Polyplosphaeria fusca TaxID=682080 RepID=A0A9P4QPJ0_9PLEO|nr:galactose oxidase [Polyplosphaeria fusca]